MKRREFINKILFCSLGFIFLPSENYVKANPVRTNLKPNPSLWRDDEINISWIGHSTVIINFYGKIILTDPVLFERIGINLFGIIIGPSRLTHPALSIDEIPKPDLILISHAHMDHMDFQTLSYFTRKYPNQIDCLTAFNTKDVIEELKWKSLSELDWNEQTNIAGINIKAVEVKHFGWRYPWERDRSKGYIKNGRSYNAYIIERNGRKIFFGGDTAYSDKFKKIKTENIDIAIMPIGAYKPWRRNHCDPEEALIMASYYLGANYFIPIHTKTFKQGSEPIEEPLNWLQKSVSNYSIKLAIKDLGETFSTS
jgi:L-ascorbate metabolism protein UlaG (beta-lactamase superfamily)